MADNTPQDFWAALELISAAHELVIDRPRGTAHPRHPSFIYPLDYGYLAGTTSQDGGGVDVWRGSAPALGIPAVCVIVDAWKKDAEIKILLGCNQVEQLQVLQTHNEKSMRGMLVHRDGGLQPLSGQANEVSPAQDFWEMCDQFALMHAVVIDRPKGVAHPRFPDFIYELDYGYLDGTKAQDGSAIDVWLGSQPPDRVTAVALIAGWQQHCCEVKLLLGCTAAEIAAVSRGHGKGLVIARPGV